MLLCELESYVKAEDTPKVKRRSRKKGGGKQNENGKNKERAVKKQTLSAFCPECQGTGMDIMGDDLEKPTVPLSEVCNILILCFYFANFICLDIEFKFEFLLLGSLSFIFVGKQKKIK